MGRPRTGEKQYQFHMYVVYGLMCGYAGYTRNIYNRMRAHKHNGKDVEGWFILGVCRSKREALDMEREFHNLGYKGKITGHHGYTEEERREARKRTVDKNRAKPKSIEARKKWREANKERIKEYQKNYRAMKKNKRKK